MSLRVAITRAAPENARTAASVRALGMTPALAPLLTIESRPFDASLGGAQALVFTSSNGAHAFAQQSPARDIAVLAVGDATAQAARDAGFGDVRAANGDVAALAALAIGALDPHAGQLIHVAGAHVAGDLGGALRKAGFTVERRLAYEAVAATTLPLAFAELLDAVTFHSARAAQVFADLGAPRAAALTAVCLSEAVAEAARKSAWKQLIVAAAPREDALLAALQRV